MRGYTRAPWARMPVFEWTGRLGGRRRRSRTPPIAAPRRQGAAPRTTKGPASDDRRPARGGPFCRGEVWFCLCVGKPLLGPARGPGAATPARPRRVDRAALGARAGTAPARPAPRRPAPRRAAPGGPAPAGPAVVDVAGLGVDQGV